MLKSIQFKNFKALRDATLPLGRFTLIVGPNGSGKSTAMQALQALHDPDRLDFHKTVSVGLPLTDSTEVEIILYWGEPDVGVRTIGTWNAQGFLWKQDWGQQFI